jgi:hypothetical protein
VKKTGWIDAELPTARGETDAVPDKRTHRLSRAGGVQLKPQELVEDDAEASSWGLSEDEIVRRRNRRLTVIAACIIAPLMLAAAIYGVAQIFNNKIQAAEAKLAKTPGAQALFERERANELVTQFLATDSFDARIALVRHPEITRPRMEKWHADPARPLTPFRIRQVMPFPTEAEQDGLDFLTYSFETEDYGVRAIAVQRQKLPTGQTLLGIDWESFVGWSEISWKDFLRSEPSAPSDFRVMARLDTYYNYAFKDQSKWFCYKLIDPEGWAHCYGYCELDSTAAALLNNLIRKQAASNSPDKEAVRTILKLHFDPQAKGQSQVIIDAVVQDGWVIP